MVEAEGRPADRRSTRVWGMAVWTNTPKVRQAKDNVELILAGHEMDCTYKRNSDLQKIAADLGIRENPFRHVERDLERDTGPSPGATPTSALNAAAASDVRQGSGLSLLDYAGRSDRLR